MNETLEIVTYYDPVVIAALKHEDEEVRRQLASHVASFCSSKITENRNVNISDVFYFYVPSHKRWFIGSIVLRKESDRLYYSIVIGHHTHCIIHGARGDYMQAEKMSLEAYRACAVSKNSDQYLNELLYGVVEYEKFKTEIRFDIPVTYDTIPQQGETKK